MATVMCSGRPDQVCPLMAAYAAADDLIEDHRHLHGNPAESHGAIEMERRSLSKVGEKLVCTGPAVDRDMENTCPLSAMHRVAQTMATVPTRRSAWHLNPEELGGGKRDSQIGQML